MSGARDAIARLRRQQEKSASRELLLPRRDARHFVDLDVLPLDYARDEERPPFEARPMFGLCEWTLILALVGLGLLFISLRFGGWK
ncbi:hypothetical protein WHT83_14830 [Aminobacter sp. P9b]|uniref:hypothetical protein n=1 Tax=Aminobacter sp. P9b TaxID=3133697 RepID=UPI00324E68DD